MTVKKAKQNKKKAQSAQKEGMRKYRLLSELMKHIPDVIYFKDTSGRLILVNDAHARGLGLGPEEVEGKTDFDFFPKERAELMTKDDRYVMETGKPIIDKIERSTRPDGVDNYVSTTKIPRYDENSRIAGIIGITRDITRRMQLERLSREKAELEKKLEASQELNRVKSEFISIVSHELRTPLAIIKEAVALLLEEVAGGINKKQKEILQKAGNNIGRLAHIIEELLDVSRIESGRFKLHYSLVNVNELLKESADFFRKLADEKGVRLEYVFPPEEVCIFLDHHRIARVVSNLIANAIKFTESGGKARVALNVLKDKIRVEVSDTGIGIAQDDLSKLFNKFTQLSKISAIERKGLGLGLSIVKELVESHGGQVWAESRLGVGSKFYFTLAKLAVSRSLARETITRINALLAKGITFYFVNLMVTNYKELKKKIPPAGLFADVEDILGKTFKEDFPLRKETPEIVSLDSRYGECSFLLPLDSDNEADKLNKAILERLARRFLKYKLKKIFVNQGRMSFPKDASRDAFKQYFNANIKVKRIYIGPQARKFKRFKCALAVNLVFPADKAFSTSTVDICAGGICFSALEALKTDSLVKVAIRLTKDSSSLVSTGRVAWVREIGGANSRYWVGLEFVRMDVRARKTLSSYIKLLTDGKEEI